ncbi:hypothetical protein B566_EDAN005063 [Ephemera danica]|nr:hypothetical protein B566_EDAN005063 [Ephemera danica]
MLIFLILVEIVALVDSQKSQTRFCRYGCTWRGIRPSDLYTLPLKPLLLLAGAHTDWFHHIMAPTCVSLMRLAVICLHLMMTCMSESASAPPPADRNQLLVLMLDGFKWDYLDLIPDKLGGFSEFVKEGVRAEHVNGIYPTLSYPSWTTLSTGLHAENHGILGNYFYNRKENAIFELHGLNNRQPFWWQTAEPVWTTATKQGLKVGTILWSRSDVAFNDILPEMAEGYMLAADWTAIENTLEKALDYIQDGFNLVMAYGEHIDNIGHRFGPKSPEIIEALVDVGKVLERFFSKLSSLGLRDNVLRNLQPLENEGVSVYERKNIPDYFHFANNVNTPDILLVAQEDFKSGVVESSIDLVDIYQIYCHVLGIIPTPHNGTWSKVKGFLTVESEAAYSAAQMAKSTLFLSTLFLLISLL